MGEASVAFQDLMAAPPEMSPADAQRRAARLLPERVAASRLGWWAPGDPAPATGRRLLIGVAAWSGYDLQLLEAVDAALAAGPRPPVVVDVFDAYAVGSADEFERYVPGVGVPYQMPVVGLWVAGQLVQSGAGSAGRRVVAGALGIDPAVIQPPPVRLAAGR